MTAIILAGGKASRMKGIDKAFLRIGKTTLINRQIAILKKIFKKIILVTNSMDKYKELKGIVLISDVIVHLGPLGGIYSGLLASKSKYNFVVACDMPFINYNLIKYMEKQVSGYDVVIPKVNHKYEPLFAIYSKGCLNYIKSLIDKKIFKIRNFFSKVKIREIGKKEILKFGYPEKIFMNINRPEDLNRINRLIKVNQC